MKSKIWKRINVLLMLIATIVSFLFSNVIYKVSADSSTESTGSGGGSVVNYDKTTVDQDLVAANIDIGSFSVLQDSPQVILFSEYCYSQYQFYDERFGLYFYVYSPTETPIYTEGNKVNMAIQYDAAGQPISYYNKDLVYLGTSGTYPYRFYKFKVKDSAWFLEQARAYAGKHGKRRYDIVGLQLAYKEGKTKMDGKYGRTYYFTGYGKGLSDESQETYTLDCQSSKLDVLELTPEFTYFRSAETSKENNWTVDQLNTAYFSVPQSYFTNYGNLQKIKAEWYEYKTNPIFVTSDADAYEALKGKVGVDMSSLPNMSDEAFPWRVIWEESVVNTSIAVYSYGQAYNPRANNKVSYTDGIAPFVSAKYEWEKATPTPQLDWLIQISEKIAKNKDDFDVSSDAVKEVALAYTQSHPDQPLVEGQPSPEIEGFAEGLFTSSIDADRIQYLTDKDNGATRGHIVQELDATDDTHDMMFEKDQSFWEKLAWWKDTTYSKTMSPIAVVESTNDIAGLDAGSFADKYYVHDSEAADILEWCKKELSKGNKPVFFRFAQTDYYASAARFDKAGGGTGMSSQDGYVAQETAFLGFDLISLTFRSAIKGDTVIGVVADPKNFFPGLDAAGDLNPNDNIDWEYWLEVILGCIVAIGIIALLSPFLPVLLNILWFIVKAPFKVLAAIFKGIGKLFKKRE